MRNKFQGHQARKRFGQNFLHDGAVIQQIIDAIYPQPNQNIVEIGPGLGALTSEILPAVDHMHLIELDRDLIPGLKLLNLNQDKMTIHQADALKFDFSSLYDESSRPLRIIGNLPYNISTPLLFHLFNSIECIQDMHFMLQKEVVQRMSAVPGNKTWGRLSVMVQYHCQVELLFLVGSGAFKPAPKVDSAIVRLIPHKNKPAIANNPEMLDKVVISAFGQRRKTLRNSLGKLINEADLKMLEIEPSLRAERLSVKDFVKIANFIDGDE
jgi:16S rRNA (adenine1518-N6/adenine1519-N6)-dimethyltransferase